MENFISGHPWIILVILLWSLPWKAAALWRSARRGQLGWFLVLIIFNTLAILDIIYLFFFSGPRELKKDSDKEEMAAQIRARIRPDFAEPRRTQLQEAKTRISIV